MAFAVYKIHECHEARKLIRTHGTDTCTPTPIRFMYSI